MPEWLRIEYDEDRAKVRLSIEDTYGNYVDVFMSAEKAVDYAGSLMHAAKVAKWRKSGILEAFGGN